MRDEILMAALVILLTVVGMLAINRIRFNRMKDKYRDKWNNL